MASKNYPLETMNIYNELLKRDGFKDFLRDMRFTPGNNLMFGFLKLFILLAVLITY